MAAANSLWWFDSKFETEPARPPSDAENNDHYPLVTSEEAWDDHWPDNVVPVVDELAHDYFHTDLSLGTEVYDMYYGIQQYLYDRGLYDDYLVTLSVKSTIEWGTDEVMRSEDAILLLGFWQEDVTGGDGTASAGTMSPSPGWTRRTNSSPSAIPMPTPPKEGGFQGWWETATSSPMACRATLGGSWYQPEYLAWDPSSLLAFYGVNPHPHPDVVVGDYVDGLPVHTEVEFAIAVSPFTWKRGESEDYGPSCIPDFSQKQDAWQNPTWGHWSYCGPVAVANSLWWFDSKFEPFPIPPPTINDDYPLVEAYGDWDDHDPQNVEGAAHTMEFVDELALLMGTDADPPRQRWERT